MTGLSRSTDGLDPRRKRILFRAWHRGIREMDLLLGRYAETVIEALSEAELDAFEQLIALDDHDLYGWLTGREPVPPEHDDAMFRAVKAFHTHTTPVGF
ncbi:MAG: succinate dehydrogenase assembly factor 2 [Rhizobiales bacterium]|nr:succinate dehydrogenase assembly factor 2 [Hyphomicrobiales bacterium]